MGRGLLKANVRTTMLGVARPLEEVRQQSAAGSGFASGPIRTSRCWTHEDLYRYNAVEGPGIAIKLVGTLGVLGFLLAIAGLYALVAYNVSRLGAGATSIQDSSNTGAAIRVVQSVRECRIRHVRLPKQESRASLPKHAQRALDGSSALRPAIGRPAKKRKSSWGMAQPHGRSCTSEAEPALAAEG